MGVILDQRYQVVKTVHPRTGGTGVDFHEFKLTESGNSALIVTYQPRFVEGAWVLDNCFEEVPLDDSALASAGDGSGTSFAWCATDHIPLSSNPNRKAFQKEAKGNGETPDRAWDYIHLNSVDKSAQDGSYLISARHLDTIFAISPADGSILWQLGGDKSSFRLDKGLKFSRQHDARFIANSSSRDINSSVTISLFNNANDGVTLKNNPSRGLLVHLDLDTMTARETASYGNVPPPANDLRRTYLSSNGMGNFQALPNGNVLTSFGRHGAIAEYATSGDTKEPVFYADFTAPSSLATASRWSASNYRAYLLPLPPSTSTTTKGATWTGLPTETPALWTYARTSTNLMTFYASWNGDTRATTYKFWISDDAHPSAPAKNTFHVAGTWDRSVVGFETNYTIGSARPWAFAEALDAAGTSLANSSVVRTYVPAEEDAKTCGKWNCFPDVQQLTAAELAPLDDAAALSGLDGVRKGGLGGLGTPVTLLEHVFALIGLGACAWWIWARMGMRIGSKRHMKGYSPVAREKEEEEQGRFVV